MCAACRSCRLSIHSNVRQIGGNLGRFALHGPAVVKDKIHIEIVFLKLKMHLPADKGKTLSEFQQKLLNVVNNCLLNL
jgi:hypothetical protein